MRRKFLSIVSIVLFLVPVIRTTQPRTSTSGECSIEEHGGFLKYRCPSDVSKNGLIRHKCHNSEEYYYYNSSLHSEFDGQQCTKDTLYYQACDKRFQGFKVSSGSEAVARFNKGTLCNNRLCQLPYNEISPRRIPTLYLISLSGFVCDGYQNCQDNVDETNCLNMTKLPSGFEALPSLVCNGKCDNLNCEDEAVCHGLTYGLYCKNSINELSYIAPMYICNGRGGCLFNEDEKNCPAKKKTEKTCTKYGSTINVPIYNYTRCTILSEFNFTIDDRASRYCVDEELKKYQTNCSDSARVGGRCYVDGYLSTVSKQVICWAANTHRICDDAIETQCPDISKTCPNMHKHRMCDNEPDCVDHSDELHSTCRNQTEATCQRKFGVERELTLPLIWLNDGVKDCIDGKDELTTIWPTCGRDTTHRFVTNNKTCQNVFLCVWEDPGFVELKDLCDGLETCGNENKICSLSRSSQEISTTVLSETFGLTETKHLSFCLKGLQSIEKVGDDECTRQFFRYPNHEYFGVDTRVKLHLPGSVQNCDHMFGEQYVFSSCSERCKTSPCPLRNPPRYEFCPNQLPDRIGTIADDKYLAFITKHHGGVYTNRFFVCENKFQCIKYSQVCDLVDDCRDKSDEAACTNHFRCKSSGRLIPKTKKCDEEFDCFDMSDECNEHCSKQILEGMYLKIIALVIGSTAIIANLAIMIKNVVSLKRCKTSVALVNKSLVIMICVGDFLVGCYLLVIAIFDTVIFKQAYCHKQVEWIYSFKCIAIGVLSTIGSQVSLFAMAGLSTVRLYGIRGPLRVPVEVNLVQSLKVALGVFSVVLTSMAIAITPVISILENFFVNGVKFADGLQLFIGTQNKQKIFAVLEAYYGRMKSTTMSWQVILKMVRNMFSNDIGNDEITDNVKKLEFYGNDGVCLFKYFVNKDDPQKDFVWVILLVNFVCFIFISISYILIGITSWNSSKKLADSQNKRLIDERQRKMNRRIAIIITTDFCCWVPFIVICALHFLEVLDATPWYAIFSMLILPINSVINPLLYDDFVTRMLTRPLSSVYGRITSSEMYQSIRANFSTTQPEDVEMEQVQAQDGETKS